MVMTGRAAIHYGPRGFDAGAERLVGRAVANAGFLRAYLDHGTPGPVHCHVASDEAFEDFRRKFPNPRQSVHVPPYRVSALADVGALHVPGPALGGFAWPRLNGDPRGYSLTGLTHAMSSPRALAAVRELLVAPVFAWDALVCTSASIRDLVTIILQGQADYLAARTGARPEIDVRLPVIPLGIDAPALAPKPAPVDPGFRARHGLAADTFVVLYLGRLSFHTKAHPFPLYIAMDRLSRRVKRPVALIEAGWPYNDEVDQAFRAGAADLAPEVTVIRLDAREPAVKRAALETADVFVSLADNIQESFGLTPVEAMAAGLPAVVSDWDGYRDTVRDGETGFLIPTLMAPPGTGHDLAWRLASGLDDQESHMGQVAQAVAVDIDATTRALEVLAGDEARRRAMSAAARAHVAEVLDWPVIIRRYEALWTELADVRRSAPAPDPRLSEAWRRAIAPDPFTVFGGFASLPDLAGGALRASGPDALKRFETIAASPIAALDRRVLAVARDLLTQAMENAVAWPAGLSAERTHDARLAARALAWLIKMGLLVGVGR